MGDVVNLNKFRKAQAKRDKATEAAENRVRHGRTKQDQATTRKDAEHIERDLDGKRLD